MLTFSEDSKAFCDADDWDLCGMEMKSEAFSVISMLSEKDKFFGTKN